ncbi:hypothetical protein Peur_068327 [Populus x canadensis]
MGCRFIGLSYAASVEVSLSMKCHFETTNSTTNPLSHGMATVSNTLSRCLADIKAYEALTLPENASQQLAYLKKLIWPLLADTILTAIRVFNGGVGGTESPMWARPTATAATFPASKGSVRGI